MPENRPSRCLHCTEQLVQWGGRGKELWGSVCYLSHRAMGKIRGGQNDFCFVNMVRGQVFFSYIQFLIDKSFILGQSFWISRAKSVSLWVISSCSHCLWFSPFYICSEVLWESLYKEKSEICSVQCRLLGGLQKGFNKSRTNEMWIKEYIFSLKELEKPVAHLL